MAKTIYLKCKKKLTKVILLALTFTAIVQLAPSVANATQSCTFQTGSVHCDTNPQPQGSYYCGDPSHPIHTAIDFGCEHKGSPMLDLLFSIIRILSDGVGVVIVASLIIAGIQYTTSAGDPNGVNTAVKRIRSNVTALLIYIFGYAILNFLIPGQLLK